jgi:hypothetical protein
MAVFYYITEIRIRRNTMETTTITVLQCGTCELSPGRGQPCSRVARTIIAERVRLDYTYKPNDKVDANTEARILLDGIGVQSAIITAGTAACAEVLSMKEEEQAGSSTCGTHTGVCPGGLA